MLGYAVPGTSASARRRRARFPAAQPPGPSGGRSASRCRSSDLGGIRRRDAGVADQHVSQTAVYDTPARAPSDEPRGVSYPVSDSLSCKRRVRGPVSWDTLTDLK